MPVNSKKGARTAGREIVRAWNAWFIDQPYPRSIYARTGTATIEVPFDRVTTFSQFVDVLKHHCEQSWCRPLLVEQLPRALEDLFGLRLIMHRVDLGDGRAELRISTKVEELDLDAVLRPDLRDRFRKTLDAWSQQKRNARAASAVVSSLPTHSYDARVLAATATVVAAVVRAHGDGPVDLADLVQRAGASLLAINARATALVEPASRIAAALLGVQPNLAIESAIADAATALATVGQRRPVPNVGAQTAATPATA